ncbi:conserved protein, unknown function, partial [Hepatocystis sp. ex Piliocolobus tephrosceles]
MDRKVSDTYVSFETFPKQSSSYQDFFDWILKYPIFNDIRPINLSNRLINIYRNEDNKQKERVEKAVVKKNKPIKKKPNDGAKISNNLPTKFFKNEINKNDYSSICNSKFYVNIIKKSETICNTYNESLKEERINKLILKRVQEKYLKKKETNKKCIYTPTSNPNAFINTKQTVLLKEKINPFFYFFEKNQNKNIYHKSINFSLKTNILLNRYFYKVILNQLKYYEIDSKLYFNILSIIHELSKYYPHYDYDILSIIKIKYFPCKNIKNSFYINGLVFTNCSIYFDNIEIKKPRILLLDAEIEAKYETFEECYDYRDINFILKKITNKTLNVILIHGELDFHIKKLLLNKKIYFFTNLKKKNLYRLSNMLRTKILQYDDFKNFDNSYIGKGNYFKIEKYKKNVKNVYVCCNCNFLTVCIFGKKDMSEKKGVVLNVSHNTSPNAGRYN